MMERPALEPATGGRPATPQLAATVVLLRPRPAGAEVLLIHRPATMAFGPGLHVFPGGRVDPEDFVPPAADVTSPAATAAARALGDNLPPGDALAVHRAAVRELREEAGVILDRVDELVPIAHWTTPAFMARRFSTWFFVADLPADAVPVFAADEVTAHSWVSAVRALEQMALGEIEMWVPTTSVLERLIETAATSAAGVARHLALGRVMPPHVVADEPTEVRFRFGAAGGLPGRRCETTLLGRRELILVDPGDASEEALDAIRSVVVRRRATIRAIVLTRTDPDHAAGAEAVAMSLDLPILVGPGAGRRLPYPTIEVAEGERLPADVEVRVRLDGRRSGLSLVRTTDR